MICVLGPTRMAYWRAVAMVGFIADLLDLLVADSLTDNSTTVERQERGANAS